MSKRKASGKAPGPVFGSLYGHADGYGVVFVVQDIVDI